jgi:hypothetical protein
MTSAPGTFGRTPPGFPVLVGFVGLAAVMATFACVTPWYTLGGTVPEVTISTHFEIGYTPGWAGYVNSCSSYLTSNYSNCATVPLNYSAGDGTALLADLYLGLLSGSVIAAVASFGGAVALLSAATGKVRVRKGNLVAIVFLAIALAAAAGSTLALPGLNGPALHAAGTCSAANGGASPCTSFFGGSPGWGCQNSSCVETNLNWQPGLGWYLGIGATAFLLATFVGFRFQPLSAPCPTCGAPNRYLASYCDTCGSPLPQHPPVVARPPRR